MNPFSKDELQRVEEITELYYYTKDLILYSEELNDLSTFMPPINEIKDAFDHFMRITSVKSGMNEGDEQYIKTNLDKVFSHIYRATFELFDYIRIYQKDSIDRKIDGISNDALIQVFPDYYQRIKPGMEDLINKIPIYKKDKDIGDPDIEVVKKYYLSIQEMKEGIRKIDLMLPALIEYEEKKKSEKRKDRVVEIAILVVVALISVAAGYFLGKL